MAADSIVTFTQDNFEAEALKSTTPVLVDFWAEWCGPCKMLAPVLDDLASEMGDKVKIGKVNIDHHQGLAAKYGVQSIPTLLLLKDGQVQEQIVGLRGKGELKASLERLAG